MEYVYPIVLTPLKKNEYYVSVPDLDVETQGKNLTNALHMAEDIICLKIIELQDNNIKLPKPSTINNLKLSEKETASLVIADADLYRKRMQNRTIKKNCTVQYWLCKEAEAAGLNFSAILQQGLKQALGYKNY